ncbi:MAG: diaminopimelate epimerase [Planctomycetota bacterium]|jgi:diaminopimelate epimerase
MKFYKYHALGNDYIVIDPKVADIELTAGVIRLICDRNYGVGSDGILYGATTEGGALKVRIFNPDGSEAEKSGNGLRIFSRYLFEKGYVTKKEFDIETMGGIVKVEIKDDNAGLIKIDMGRITFISDEIPVKGPRREVVNEELEVGGARYKVTCASVGNPHCVIMTDEVTEEKARQLGPFVENHEMFPNRINMQLMKIIDRAAIEIRIWERGAGYTLASGSSSCAAAGAAYKLGLADEKINVKMPGGDLLIEIEDGEEIFMTGPVEGVFTGSFHEDIWKA